MAVVTDTIAKTGGDYNTIAGWEADTNLNGGADIWKGVISDNGAYDEAVVMNVNGTGTSSYAWLTVDSANRTSIVGYATGRARLDYTGGNTAAIQIEGDYARVSGLQILRSGAGSSDEGIRVTGADNVLISRCVIWHDDATVHTDGIYITGASSPTSIDNCVIWGWGRAGIHSQSSGTRTINVDHCTIGKCATNTGSDHYGLIGSSNGSTDTYNVYNTIALENASGAETGEIEQEDTATTTTTLNGSHIVVTADSATYIRDIDTDNVTNWVAAGDQWSTTAPATAGVRIVDDTIAAWDATLVDHANNVALEAGTNRQGSEPDARQDFGTDLLGNSRPTTGVDIGCHQLSGDTSTTASAEAATGTGTGSNTSTAIGAQAEAATGTGTGSDATVGTGAAAAAEAATGTGTGSDATVSAAVVASAEVASGTGTGSDAVAAGVQTASAEASSGTGTGHDATVSTAASDIAPAEVASGTGTGSDATVAVTTGAEAATGTGTGSDATATGVQTASAEAASGTGTGSDATTAIGAQAEAASGTGTGSDATVSTSSDTTAPAEVASGTGTGSDATIAVGVSAEAASGTGTGSDATVSTDSSTTAPAEVASGTGTGSDATISAAVTASAEAASGTGSGHDATGAPVASPDAEAASGTGTASDATIAVTTAAEAASGTGDGFDATGEAGTIGDADAEAATGTGTGHDATISVVGVSGDPGVGFAGLVAAMRAESRTARRRREAPLCPHSNHRMVRHGSEWVCEFDGYSARSL